MIGILKAQRFTRWFDQLPDARARCVLMHASTAWHWATLALGNPGDVQPVGEGVSELRIPYGPGHRVYYLQQGSIAVVLLCGGDKSSQRRDIKLAKAMATELRKTQ